MRELWYTLLLLIMCTIWYKIGLNDAETTYLSDCNQKGEIILDGKTFLCLYVDRGV